jgi:3-phenylpropionate/cinnamic acid dioxygenase small subunit
MTETPEIQTWYDVQQFLYNEAKLLDEGQLEEWEDLLSEDIDYRIPVRMSRERDAPTEFSDVSYHVRENADSIRTRIKRFQTDYTWSDNPPYRIRRLITNVQLRDIDEDRIEVDSYVLMTRSQKDETDTDIVSGERHDVLRRTDDGLRLVERTVFIDQTVLSLNFISLKEFL